MYLFAFLHASSMVHTPTPHHLCLSDADLLVQHGQWKVSRVLVLFVLPLRVIHQQGQSDCGIAR